jgi:hypothetical protein
MASGQEHPSVPPTGPTPRSGPWRSWRPPWWGAAALLAIAGTLALNVAVQGASRAAPTTVPSAVRIAAVPQPNAARTVRHAIGGTPGTPAPRASLGDSAVIVPVNRPVVSVPPGAAARAANPSAAAVSGPQQSPPVTTSTVVAPGSAPDTPTTSTTSTTTTTTPLTTTTTDDNGPGTTVPDR